MDINLSKFIVEEGIIGITLGTLLGFATTNYIKSLRNQIILPFIMNYFKLDQRFDELISSTIEFAVVLLLVFLAYKYIIFPIFQKHIKREQKKKEKIVKWRKDVLDDVEDIDKEVRKIDDKIYNLNYGIF